MDLFDQFLDSDKPWEKISGSPSLKVTDTPPSVRDEGDPLDDFLDSDESWEETKKKPDFSFKRLATQAYRSAGQGLADVGRFAGALESQVSDFPGGTLGSPEEEMGYGKVEEETEPREVRRERLQEYFDTLPKPLEGSSGIIEDAVGGMARFLPSMGVSAVNPIAGTAMTFAQIAGMSYDDYIKQGADKDRAFTTAVANSMAQTPLEMAGNLLQIGALKNFAKSIGAGAKIGTKLQKFLGALITGVAGEGMEEFLQQFPDEIANYYIANPDLSANEIVKHVWENKEEIAKRGLEAAKVGAVGGGLLAGAGGVIATPFHISDYVSKKQKEINSKKETPSIEEIKKSLESGEITPDVVETMKDLWGYDTELVKELDKILGVEEKTEPTKPVFTDEELDGLTVSVEAMSEEGEIFTVQENAKTALNDSESRIETLYSFLECLS